MTSLLPDGYEALEPFVDDWAIAGTANRAQRRTTSTESERVAFFEVAKGFVIPALDQLDRKPLDQFDAREKRLMDLMLSFAHVALAVEIQGDDEARHARFRQFMKITKSPADVGP